MSDYKIIGGDQREYGPVSTEEVAQWIQQGRANGDTQVQAVGSEDWVPLRDVPELTPALAATAGPPPMPPMPPGGPGSPPPPHTTIPSPHTPFFSPPPTADQLMAELKGRSHTFSIGDCFSQGWRLTMDNFGTFLLAVICFMGLSVVAGFVPFGSLILSGPLMGGIYLIYLRRLRGEFADMGTLFDGFRDVFMGLFLYYVFLMLLMFVGNITGIVAVIAGMVMGMLEASAQQPPILALVLMGIGVLLGLLITTILYGMFIFGIPLVADRRMEATEAFKVVWRVTKNCWGTCFLLFFCTILINIVGVLLLCLGALVTVPLSFAMTIVAYDRLFGRPTMPR